MTATRDQRRIVQRRRDSWRDWFTPRRAVIAYFACFALVWIGVAVWATESTEVLAQPPHATRAPVATVALMLGLGAHAAAIALLAWKAARRFFEHALLATTLAGLPLVVLLAKLWLVPAFFYVIAVLNVGLAARHESLGRLQATPRPSIGSRTG